MTAVELLFPALALSAGAFVTALAGFGFGLVAMSVLPWFVGMRSASVLVTLFSFVNLTASLYPLRRHVRAATLLPLLAGLAVGVPLGVFLLVSLDEVLLKRLLGAAIILYLGVDILVLSRLTVRLPRWAGVVAGVVGGALGGAFSTAGPPGVVYINCMRLDKEETKATILCYLLATTTYKLPFLIAGGLVTGELLLRSAIWLAPVALATLAGVRLFARMSTAAFGTALRVLLAASAVVLIAFP
jgi:uncharacterized protein